MRADAVRRPCQGAGFTLLEAIVALVIFSLVAVSLYAWQGTNIRALLRIQDRQNLLRDRANALSLVRGINPMARPEGVLQFQDLTIRWQSRLLEPIKTGVFQTGKPSLFDVGLYELEFVISRQARETDRFTLRQVGHRQPRHLDNS